MEEKLARLTKLEGPGILGRKTWNGQVTRAMLAEGSSGWLDTRDIGEHGWKIIN